MRLFLCGGRGAGRPAKPRRLVASRGPISFKGRLALLFRIQIRGRSGAGGRVWIRSTALRPYLGGLGMGDENIVCSHDLSLSGVS